MTMKIPYYIEFWNIVNNKNKWGWERNPRKKEGIENKIRREYKRGEFTPNFAFGRPSIEIRLSRFPPPSPP